MSSSPGKDTSNTSESGLGPTSEDERQLAIPGSLPPERDHDSLLKVPPRRLGDAAPPIERKRLQSTSIVHHEQTAGPIPGPTMMRGYKEVHPGFPEYFLRTGEKVLDHQIAMERRDADARDQIIAVREAKIRRGQWHGFVIAIAFVLMLGAALVLVPAESLVRKILLGVIVALGGGSIGTWVISEIRNRNKKAIRDIQRTSEEDGDSKLDRGP
jgi:hypothetical protein